MSFRDPYKEFAILEDLNRLFAVKDRPDKEKHDEMFGILVLEERRFRDILMSTKHGRETYMKFIDHIMNVKGNILSARVYFRERQDAFDRKISDAFRRGAPAAIEKLHPNHAFASWVVEVYKGPKKRSLAASLRRIRKQRDAIYAVNWPLALNRAKRFWFKVPAGHQTSDDHLQNAQEGLVTAIDKYVPGDSTYGSVAIGRITLNLLTSQNQTLIKFSPREMRIMYRANKARNQEKIEDDGKVEDYVRESFKGTNKKEIEMISAAQSMQSLDYKPEGGVSLHDTVASRQDLVEEAADSEMVQNLLDAMGDLDIMERKAIVLRSGCSEGST